MPTSRRKKLTLKQGLALVKSFQNSGLSPRSFCEKHRIPSHVLRHWTTKHLQSNTQDGNGRWIPVKPLLKQPSGSPIRILLPAGIVLEIPSGVDGRAFNQIMETCCHVVNR